MGYVRLPVEPIAEGQALNSGAASGMMYLDAAGNMDSDVSLKYNVSIPGIGLGAAPQAQLYMSGAVTSAVALSANGVGLCAVASTYTDTVTSGTVTNAAVHSFGVPTLAASAASTYTNSSTVYIAGATVAGTNVTATNKYSLWIAGGNVLLGALDIQLDSTTGTKIGTAVSQKLAFLGSTPVVQRVGAAQAAVVTTASTTTTPFGFTTSAQADAIVTLVNELRAALLALGLIKGAA